VKRVSIIGHKKSGKTRLIERLIPVLTARGKRVGTIKDAPHTLVLGDPKTDSSRHRRAGAERTLLLGEDGAILIFDRDEAIEKIVEEAFAGFDIVLVEGLKDGPFPKIEVYRRDGDPIPPLGASRTIVCLVTDEPDPPVSGVPILSPSDIEGIADLIERL